MVTTSSSIEKIKIFNDILEAMAVGVEVKMDGRFFVMSDGLLYTKHIDYNLDTKRYRVFYRGYNHMPYDHLMHMFLTAAEDKNWLADVRMRKDILIAIGGPA
jgi:hypothetical protein